jgi:hypothetical protein
MVSDDMCMATIDDDQGKSGRLHVALTVSC